MMYASFTMQNWWRSICANFKLTFCRNPYTWCHKKCFSLILVFFLHLGNVVWRKSKAADELRHTETGNQNMQRKIEMNKWAGTRKKGPYRFPVCVSSNAHARSSIWTIDMRVLLDASSRSLLHVCEQQRLWRDCVYVQFRLCVYWLPIW